MTAAALRTRDFPSDSPLQLSFSPCRTDWLALRAKIVVEIHLLLCYIEHRKSTHSKVDAPDW